MQEIKNLAKTVKTYRKAKGISQQALMKKSGLSARTIDRVENANKTRYNPRLDTLAYLAHGLGTDLSDLLRQPAKKIAAKYLSVSN